jgi:hypothetical protein
MVLAGTAASLPLFDWLSGVDEKKEAANRGGPPVLPWSNAIRTIQGYFQRPSFRWGLLQAHFRQHPFSLPG